MRRVRYIDRPSCVIRVSYDKRRERSVTQSDTSTYVVFIHTNRNQHLRIKKKKVLRQNFLFVFRWFELRQCRVPVTVITNSSHRTSFHSVFYDNNTAILAGNASDRDTKEVGYITSLLFVKLVLAEVCLFVKVQLSRPGSKKSMTLSADTGLRYKLEDILPP